MSTVIALVGISFNVHSMNGSNVVQEIHQMGQGIQLNIVKALDAILTLVDVYVLTLSLNNFSSTKEGGIFSQSRIPQHKI